MIRIYSWNVNGIRAVQKKGFINWLEESNIDILALQETKAQQEQLDKELTDIGNYKSYFHSAVKKGYSGTAIYSSREPEQIENLGIEKFDNEGRTLIAHYKNFSFINCYFPNSQGEGARLDYKLEFCDAILNKCNALVEKGRNILLCGDYNIAHKEIDLKNPKANEKNAGYLPEERNWMNQFLSAGYRDTFRDYHPEETGHYTWWSYRFNARKNNAGWRIDYHCVNNGFAPKVLDSKIHNTIAGSDHCPISINLDIDL